MPPVHIEYAGPQVKVTRMTGRTGRPVKNQYVIDTNRGSIFQSYATLVAFREHVTHHVTLDRCYWDYSRTTLKYMNKFLGESTQTIRDKIRSGAYTVVESLVDWLER